MKCPKCERNLMSFGEFATKRSGLMRVKCKYCKSRLKGNYLVILSVALHLPIGFGIFFLTFYALIRFGTRPICLQPAIASILALISAIFVIYIGWNYGKYK
jgi:DNA-directed RNA polymerase subunit RPC12/RpoP